MTVPTLRTERLILSGHRPADFEEIAAMWEHPAVYRMIGGVVRAREDIWIRLLRSIGQWQAFGYGSWVLRDHGGTFVGEIGLMEARRAIDPPLAWPEMGWTLSPAVHGRGYAREALSAILDWTTAQGIARTTCIIDPGNAPSLTLAARVGYAPVREALYKDHPIVVLER